MNSIVCQKIGDVTKVMIQSLDKKSDIGELIKILQSDEKFELNFLNIQYLSKKIILRLYELKDNIKIYTNENVLKTYLNNLGFDITLKDKYSNKTKALSLECIVIGGSAGSLKKFAQIIQNLPPSNLSIFIIMHQKADTVSNLSHILQTYTNHYKVVQAASDMKIEPACIYTAPPGKHLIVASGFIFLTDGEKRNYSKPSISISFESLSNEYKNSLLAIMVCGYGADGSDSLKLLKDNNSTVIIENPDECEAKAILENCIKTNLYDYIHTINEMNEYIKRILENEFLDNKNLVNFLKKIYEKYGYDYRGYNLEHIKRRIKLFYSIIAPKNFLDFENKVLENSSIFKDLFLNISVNITTFFRNPEIFKVLKQEVLPKLDSFVDIKVWCAGCSSGEEPYSIAIILKELGLLHRSLIYATDLNDVVLSNAKNGIYSKESYNRFLKHYYEAGGEDSFSSYFDTNKDFVCVKDEIKERILFFKHNLAIDGKINDFQLIFCRNVIIYFDEELKHKIFKLFNESLDNYGFVILGESESLDNNVNYITFDKKNKIYKKKI